MSYETQPQERIEEEDPNKPADDASSFQKAIYWLGTNYNSIIKTCLMFYCMVNFGLQQEAIGPSIPTLVNVMKSDYTRMGRSLASKSGGLFVGAFFGGAIGDRILFYRRDLALCLSMISTSVEFFFIPYVRQPWQFDVILFGVGVSHSIISIIIDVNISELWHGNSGPAYNFIYTGLGVGAILAAFILRQYTIDENPLDKSSPHGVIELSTPYIITASLAFIAAILAFIYYAIGIVEDRKRDQSIYAKTIEERLKEKMETEEDKNKCLKVLKKISHLFLPKFEIEKGTFPIFVLVPMIMFFLYGIERVVGGYLFSYLVNSRVHFTSENGLFTVFLFWLSFTVGRIIFLTLSAFVGVSYLFLLSSVGTLVSFGAFSLIAPIEASVYTVIFFVAFFTGALFPCFLATADQVIHVTGLLVMFIEIGGSIGAVIMNQVIGYIMDTGMREYYPISLTIVSTGLLVFGIIYVVFIEKMRRDKKK